MTTPTLPRPAVERDYTVMGRAQARLDWITNPVDQALFDALVGAAEFVDEFVPGCVGERDIPDTRMEPGYCECRISDDEEREASVVRAGLAKAIAKAEAAAFTDEQLPWVTDIRYPERLPAATCELLSLATYVRVRLAWLVAGELRSDEAQMIEELREELA